MVESLAEFRAFLPINIMFGCGQLKNLHTAALPGKKALIVITNGKSVKENGYLDALIHELTLAGVGYSVFDKITANPTDESVMRGAAQARADGCDFVVGLGGGSPIDASKGIAIMVTNEGTLWDYMPSGTGKGVKTKNSPLPIVAITTTAGTGSEADPAFVATNEATNEKIGMYHPDIYPRIAIVDPELMVSVPPRYTAFQGFDALFHCTEGYISNKAHFFSDMLAITGIEHIGASLAAAVKDGKNMKARESVAFAASISGMQIIMGSLTSAHSLEHAMSAYHPNLPHGAGLIIISVAYYSKFKDVPESKERLVKMAKALGKADAKSGDDFITALKGILADCGVAGLKMSDYGIVRDELPVFVQNAKAAMGSKFFNDPRMLSDEEILSIYEQSYQ
ncbi:MAG: iron-containing alcohol dehydrogenase [Oscillospiraceae bacterium]|nr:iron-containing alcohol dehydrogenase [Oscillospiraceae bacterium]